MRKLLITGFNPFDERGYNTTSEVLELLPETIANFSLSKRVIPVEWLAGEQHLLNLCEREKPDAILSMGMSKQTVLQFESLAKNHRKPFLTDNLDQFPPATLINNQGPAHYSASWIAPQPLPHLFKNGLEMAHSEDAGGYLCNQTFFLASQYAASQKSCPPVAFIHIPPRPEDGGQAVRHTAEAMVDFLKWSLPLMPA
jgi:pyroglutamyl-peptidase